MVESTESYDTGGRGTMTLSAGEDDTPAVPNTVPHTSVDTAPAGPSPEKALPPFTDADLLAEEEAIREEPEDEVIAGIMTPAAEERLTDSGDAATLGGAAPGMTATAPAAMTEGDAVNRGTSATILLVSTSSGTEHPIILTIYTTNPYETERAIMDKAMELGGDVKRMRYSESGEMLSRETEESSEFVEGNLPPTVYLPPEGVEDLLMFIESQYPPIGPELEELDMTDKRELLQLDFIAPDGGH